MKRNSASFVPLHSFCCLAIDIVYGIVSYKYFVAVCVAEMIKYAKSKNNSA
jgi:hypothetical protein